MKRKSVYVSLLLAVALLLSMFLYSFPVSAAEFEIEIGSVQGALGEAVTVPIIFRNVPAAGVNSCDFVINYDTNILEAAENSVAAGPVTKNASETFSSMVDANHGTIKFLYSDETGLGKEAVTSDGVFANIRFIIKQNAVGSLSNIKVTGEWAFGNTVFEYITTRIIDGCVEVIAEQGYKVSGYIVPDLTVSNQAAAILKSGFNVEIAGTTTSTVTDQNGFFVLNTGSSMTNCTLRITKDRFLYREIKNISLNNSNGCTEVSSSVSPIKMWAGDINNDNAINIADIMEVCKAFNTFRDSSKFKNEYDVNKDDAVNITDIMVIVQHFNKVTEDYK